MNLRPLIVPPARLRAEVLHRAMRSGRNRALHVGARDAAGTLLDCVVKLPGLMEMGSLHPLPSLLEWLGTILAAEFGILAPPAYEVDVTPAFASVVIDPVLAPGVRKSVGSVFGSGFVQGSPMMAGELIDPSLRGEAAKILAFDAFIHNADRRAVNPNLFLGRNGFIVYDHGDAFSFVWPLLLAPDPAEDPLLSMLDQHVFAPLLRRQAAPDLTDFSARLAGLDDARLQAVAAAAPSAWQTGSAAGKLSQIVDVLKRRRDAAVRWIPQVEAWMKR